MFTIAVNHVRDTILSPHSDHLSFFFSAIVCLILCYSFFLSPHYGTKSHTVVIIIFYATNDFYFFLNFRISSKSILHNHPNSIHKLNYDRRKWANTFLFFFFSSCLFFLGVELCYFFFLFFSRLFFSFFLLELRCFSTSLFGVGLFSFFFLGDAEFVLLVFGLFSLFLIFWGPCVFSLSPSLSPSLSLYLSISLSLSFDRLNKPLRNRFLIFLSHFSDRLRGTMVNQSYYTHDTDMPSSGAKYVYVT